MFEYRALVNDQELLSPMREDDYLGQNYKADAETYSLIGLAAFRLHGTQGLAWATLLEWRAEDPTRRHNVGRVERRQVSDWQVDSQP